MGNHHKFKLSGMIPNAWLHKLKALSTPKSPQNSTPKHHRHQSSSSSSDQQPQVSHQRKSYYFTRDLTTAATAKQESSDKKRSTTVLTGCGCPVSATIASVVCTKLPPPDSTPQVSSADNQEKLTKIQPDAIASLPVLKLPPIRTNIHVKSREQEHESPRRLSVGVKLRSSSPRIMGNKRLVGRSQGSRTRTRTRKRRSLSESFAVVKSSKDPKRDFIESMVEMIVENNLRGSKELEDLLACYLSLNSSKYHDLIIGVFKQLWFEYVVAS